MLPLESVFRSDEMMLVIAKALVVPLPREKFPPLMSPLFEMEKSVEVADVKKPDPAQDQEPKTGDVDHVANTAPVEE